MEWTNNNKYNSFNSYKGLTYYEHYRKIADWMNGSQYLPPSVECNLDIFAECNLRCYFCVGQRYLRANRSEVEEMRILSGDYMLRLVDFLAAWGVRGLCISGGGEPTLHPALPKVIRQAHEKMDVAVVTNATTITNDLAEALMLCRWVALSVDAGDKETYQTVKGRNYFDRVTNNIQRLTNLRRSTGSRVDLGFKFLLLPENVQFIHETCKLAKELGVQDFHVRPVDFERSDIEGHKKLELDKDLVLEEFDKCHEEETEDFHVYTITHKFDSNFHVKHDFTKCLATPLVIPILQNQYTYLCVDKKMERPFRLGSCNPPENVLTWWGSKEHLELVKSVDISKCSRCTWSQYNSQMEEVVLRDKMCLSFP